MDEILNSPVRFGLVAQGHVPRIRQMLKEKRSWEEIGRAIGWDPLTACSHFLEYEQEAFVHMMHDAQGVANGLVQEVREHMAPLFPPDTRGLEWDVLPSAVGAVCRELAGYREATEPSADTKAAFHGEFRIQTRYPEFVPWSSVKQIMKAIRERAEDKRCRR